MKAPRLNRHAGLFSVLTIVFLVGCGPAPMQPPPGTSAGPNNAPAQAGQPQSTVPAKPKVSDSQRWQYAWNRAMEGVAMGGSIAGPYGAGGGLIVGLIAGLLTANSHYGKIQAQIQVEEQKDKELEAQLEREIERQRKLEAQLEKDVEALDSQGSEPTKKAEAADLDQTVAKADPETPTSASAPSVGDSTHPAENSTPQSPPTPEETMSAEVKDQIGALASLGKKQVSSEIPPPSVKTVVRRDVNKDGTTDLWIYYDLQNPGEVKRQEEDTDWNGSVDTWSDFTDGKLVRRRLDTNGDGKADKFFYYENESLAKVERDEKGEGQPNYRALYTNGRLAKVEKDLNQDGKMDLWIYYDTNQDREVRVKEERDLNSNGGVDVWSYYEDDRLVRRDVSTVGLDYLLNQEKGLPDSPPTSTPKG